MRTVAITSTGRTGTRMLAERLASLPLDVEVHHNSRNTALVNCITNVCLDRLAPPGALRLGLGVLKRGELDACKAAVYVDSNNHLYGAVSLAPEFYPRLSVAHIVRDPREYIRSHLNWAYSRPKSRVANFLLPFWQPNGWLAEGIPLGLWLRMDRIERFAWIWSFKNRTIRRAADLGVSCSRFRFEDLCDRERGDAAMRSLLAFCGFRNEDPRMPWPHARLNRSLSTRIPRWPEWADWHCAAVDWWCGQLMREYGYGDEVAWREKVERGAGKLTRRYARARRLDAGAH